MRAISPWIWLSAWGPPLAWGILIWQLGSDGFSESETRGFLGPLIEQFLPWFDAEHREALAWWVRKSAHPSIYAVLALLSWRGIDLTLDVGRWARRLGVLAPVVGLALGDEARQAFSSVRSGSMIDVLLDLGGGVLALILLEKLMTTRGQRLFGHREST